MPATNGRIFGCNVIDPLLEVRSGTDYTLPVIERSLVFLRELGHDAIEYSHACHFTLAECETIRMITERLGLVPWSLHAWAAADVRTEAGRHHLRRVLSTAMENAEALGVGIVVHHPSGGNVALEAETLAELIRPGIRLAFENMDTVQSMEYAILLADAVGPTRAGVCADTGHAALGDLGAARAIRMAGRWLITTHLQDNHGKHDDHMPPGDGTIDWNSVVAALNEVQYPGCVMLELTDQPNSGDRRAHITDELRRGAEAARALAAKLKTISTL